MPIMRDILAGAAAGLVATLPMTSVMEAMFRSLPASERYPLPPKQVTMSAVRALGQEQQLEEVERQQLTLVAHFGMGAAMGALYGGLNAKLPLAGPVAGAGIGLGVWAGNYLGLLPSVGLLSPVTQHPGRRTALMIAAHLVWGTSAGTLLALYRTHWRRELQQQRGIDRSRISPRKIPSR